MSKSIIQKYAELLTAYSLKLKKGDRVLIRSTYLSEPLLQALQTQITQLGAFAEFDIHFNLQDRLYYNEANTKQLKELPTLYAHAVKHFDALITIRAPFNMKSLNAVSNDKKTILIEINTETDFAAKNDIFLNFFEQIGNYVLSLDSYSEISNDDLMSNFLDDKLISEHFTEIISKIGENIILKKIHIIKNNSHTNIFTYTHNSYRKNIGKICVALQAQIDSNKEELKQSGKNLCMHIAALKPLAIDIDALEDDFIKKEKEIQLENIKSSGKQENIIDKILEGKMKKLFSEITLFNQKYILDEEKTVKNVISEFNTKYGNFKIVDYVLFVLGSE